MDCLELLVFQDVGWGTVKQHFKLLKLSEDRKTPPPWPTFVVDVLRRTFAAGLFGDVFEALSPLGTV